MEIAIPQGRSPGMVVSDTLPAGMVWLQSPGSCAVVRVDPAVILGIRNPVATFTPDGTGMTLNLGRVVNLHHSDPPLPPQLVWIECSALVLNQKGTTVVNHSGDSKVNVFALTPQSPSGQALPPFYS